MKAVKQTAEELAAAVQIAKRDVERAKCLYFNHEASYDDMAAAAKHLSSVMFAYGSAKFPGKRIPRIPYQAILR